MCLHSWGSLSTRSVIAFFFLLTLSPHITEMMRHFLRSCWHISKRPFLKLYTSLCLSLLEYGSSVFNASQAVAVSQGFRNSYCLFASTVSVTLKQGQVVTWLSYNKLFTSLLCRRVRADVLYLYSLFRGDIWFDYLLRFKAF